jgi:hypothetical protein
MGLAARADFNIAIERKLDPVRLRRARYGELPDASI